MGDLLCSLSSPRLSPHPASLHSCKGCVRVFRRRECGWNVLDTGLLKLSVQPLRWYVQQYTAVSLCCRGRYFEVDVRLAILRVRVFSGTSVEYSHGKRRPASYTWAAVVRKSNEARHAYRISLLSANASSSSLSKDALHQFRRLDFPAIWCDSPIRALLVHQRA